MAWLVDVISPHSLSFEVVGDPAEEASLLNVFLHGANITLLKASAWMTETLLPTPSCTLGANYLFIASTRPACIVRPLGIINILTPSCSNMVFYIDYPLGLPDNAATREWALVLDP